MIDSHSLGDFSSIWFSCCSCLSVFRLRSIFECGQPIDIWMLKMWAVSLIKIVGNTLRVVYVYATQKFDGCWVKPLIDRKVAMLMSRSGCWADHQSIDYLCKTEATVCDRNDAEEYCLESGSNPDMRASQQFLLLGRLGRTRILTERDFVQYFHGSVPAKLHSYNSHWVEEEKAYVSSFGDFADFAYRSRILR